MELKTENITKRFRDKLAVNKVNLTLTPGIWGLLGANGAGKTTLIRMLADIMKPTEGRILYNSMGIHKNGEEYRSVFGFLPQEFNCSSEFSVKDYLEYVAALKGLDKSATKTKINEMLDVLTLDKVKKNKVVKLSGGMRRRVGIAQAMLNNPKVLILDEPTAGLDPGERVRFRNFISEFAQDRIVIISTHIVSDIEYISTKNAIMKDGKIIDVGTTEELTDKIKRNVWNVIISANDLPMYEMKLRIVNRKQENNSMVSIRYLSEKSEIANSKLKDPNLEDLYLWLFPDNKI